MANSEPEEIEISEHQSLNETNQKPLDILTTGPTKTLSVTDHIGSIVELIIYVITASIPILQLYIGLRYTDKCPFDWHIPHYLIVAGAVGITIVLLAIIYKVLALKISLKHLQQTFKLARVGLFCIVAVQFTLLLFLFVWYCSGCYWIFRSWHMVQYVDATKNDYCHPVLHHSASLLLIISLIFKVVPGFLPCMQLPAQLKKLTNVITPVTTTEI